MSSKLKAMVTLWVSIVILTSLTWLGLQYFACHKKPGYFHSYGHADWVEKLKLTKAQQKELKELEQRDEPKFNQLSLQLAQVRLLLCDLLRKSELVEADIEKYTREIGRFKAEEEKLTVLHLLNIKSMLTEEQSNGFFTVIMRDICNGCKHSTGKCDCQCGLCGSDIKHK
ncbi:MAG: hypothetical protein ABII27_00810 [bacterium]